MHHAAQMTVTDTNHIIHTTMISEDDMSDDPSSAESTFDDSELLDSSVTDDVAAQLAAAGG